MEREYNDVDIKLEWLGSLFDWKEGSYSFPVVIPVGIDYGKG